MSGTVVAAGPNDAGERADRFVAARIPGVSRSLAQRLMHDGRVTRGRMLVRPGDIIRAGDTVTVDLNLPRYENIQPQPMPLDIVYEDDALAVVNKPPGLVVHPAPGHLDGTLVNALLSRFPTLHRPGATVRPGLVHRLDKDTSGLMVVALTDRALGELAEQIRLRHMKRRYTTLVGGELRPNRALIDVPVGRDPSTRQRMACGTKAIHPRDARTRYDVLERFPGLTLAEATLETGRTHQIRVQMAYIGHPVAGDELYGGPPLHGLYRQFLHAHALSLRSPATGKIVDARAPLPDDLAEPLSRLRMQVAAHAGTAGEH